MKVLVACEFSQIVTEQFILRGHDAMSCDLLPAEKNYPHYQGDVMDIINNGWDMMIAHPPCTYLSVAGAAWINSRPERKHKMIEAAIFFKLLLESNINKICIENPVMYLDAIKIIGKKYSQIIEPYYFGDPYKKRTCLWLKGLPPLTKTTDITPKHYWVNSSSNYRESAKLEGGKGQRDQKERSRTFVGIAKAMAEQWG